MVISKIIKSLHLGITTPYASVSDYRHNKQYTLLIINPILILDWEISWIALSPRT